MPLSDDYVECIVVRVISVRSDNIRRHRVNIGWVHTVGVGTYLYDYCVYTIVFNVCDYFFYVFFKLGAITLFSSGRIDLIQVKLGQPHAFFIAVIKYGRVCRSGHFRCLLFLCCFRGFSCFGCLCCLRCLGRLWCLGRFRDFCCFLRFGRFRCWGRFGRIRRYGCSLSVRNGSHGFIGRCGTLFRCICICDIGRCRSCDASECCKNGDERHYGAEKSCCFIHFANDLSGCLPHDPSRHKSTLYILTLWACFVKM